MDSKHILEKSLVGTRVGGADFNCRAGRAVLRDARVPTLERNGPLSGYTNGPVHHKFVLDGGSPAEVRGGRISSKGNGLCRILQDMEKVSGICLC